MKYKTPELKKISKEGIFIERGAAGELGTDQERWHITSDVDIGATTTTTVDAYTVATAKTLQVYGYTVSVDDTSSLNNVYIARKSGTTYYPFNGGHFVQKRDISLTVPFQINAGESLAIIIENVAGSEKNFIYSFNGFLHSKR